MKAPTVPIDLEGKRVTADHYRSDTMVAEITSMDYDHLAGTWRVTYRIVSTLSQGMCSLGVFLTYFPWRVETREEAARRKELAEIRAALP